MNVCLVSREYPPYVGGGIGTYTVAFARALADAGHRPVVVTVSGTGREERETDGGVAVVRLPFLDGDDWSAPHPSIRTGPTLAAFRAFHPVSVFAMQVAEALPRLVGEFEIDAAEAPECGALAWFALNRRRCGRPWSQDGRPVPLLTHLHSPTEWIERWNGGPEPGRAMAELRRMEADAVRWSDGLVCPSEALAAWAGGHWGLAPRAVEIIPYPLGSLEALAQRAASEPSPPRRPGPLRVLYAGRLEPRKGADTLVAGFAAAVEHGADLELTLAGRDTTDVRTGRPFGAACIDRLSPSARARLHVAGQLEPGALARARAAVDLVVVPSPMDNFPCTLVEAMAEGKPVLTTRAGGMAEIVRDGVDGMVFEPADPEACAAALIRAAADPQLARFGQAGARRILDMCGNAAVVARRIAHYERIIDARRAKTARPRSAARPTLAVINRGSATDADVGALADGLIAARESAVSGNEAASPSFAHGWVRVRGGGGGEGRVHAFGTPTLEGLALGPRFIGPLVVTEDSLEPIRARLRPAGASCSLPAAGESHAAVEYTAEDPWLLALLLCSAGRSGVVVPDVVTEIVRPGTANGRAGNAEAELERILASRGWRTLERMYDLLHVLRGRGLRRPGRASGRL